VAVEVKTVTIALPIEDRPLDTPALKEVMLFQAHFLQCVASMLYRSLAGIHPILDPEPDSIEMCGEEIEAILETDAVRRSGVRTSVVRWTRGEKP